MAGNDATVVGTVSYATAASGFGQCYQGSGNDNNYLITPNMLLTRPLTVECRLMFTQVPTGTQVLVGLGSQQFIGSSGNKITAAGLNSNTITMLSTTSIVANTWYAVAVECRSDNTVHLYINGVREDQKTSSGEPFGPISVPIRIGRYGGSGFPMPTYARVDEIRVTRSAIYNSDSGYSPATSPFSDVGTAQALYHLDGSGTDSATAAPTITAGAVSIYKKSTTSVTVQATAATNATGTISYQWQKAADSSGTPGTFSNVGSAQNGVPAGVAPNNYVDNSVSAGTTYWYRIVATDSLNSSTSSNYSVTTPSTTAVLAFIGDSITYGYSSPGAAAPPAQFKTLGAVYIAGIDTLNSGISGTMTSDWLPAGTNLPAARSAAWAYGCAYASVMLGTNDAQKTVKRTPAAYKTNLLAICNYLITNGLTVFLNYPPFVDYPTNFNNWDADANPLIQQYHAQIDSLVNGTTILQGDRSAYDWFLNHTSQFADGVHPNATGSKNLAALWLDEFRRQFGLAATKGTGGGASSAIGSQFIPIGF